MSTKLFPAVVLVLALGQVACSEDINVAPSPEPGDQVTETFTGTLTLNGANTHPFSVSRSGQVQARIGRLEPDGAVTVGLSLGTWNGAACQTIISNDSATLNTVVVGVVDREGRLCVRMYDAAGTLPRASDYEIVVLRP